MLNIKFKHNLSNSAFDNILSICGKGEASLYTVQKKLSDLVKIKPIFILMCVNSCCVFTDEFIYDISYHWCDEVAYNINRSNTKTLRKVATFLLLLDRLKI